eukprot:TRINITY_DN4962_c0_g1_i1.p1 TRINITY_DN4962_c0_g1~~TRINITY_DN4962_c0_g1_i1.p1  ORF type:complete len:427 (-),score=109.05 TRINITY_DN4962_c0_g1_i1:371-1651(-)
MEEKPEVVFVSAKDLSLVKVEDEEFPTDHPLSAVFTKKNVVGVNIYSCQLRHLPNSFAKVSLTRVSLANNELTAIPSVIFDLPLLQNLDLSNNLITQATGSWQNLPKLEELNLTANLGCSIGEGFSELIGLKILKMSSSDLDYIPQQVLLLPSLIELHLSRNKIKSLPALNGTHLMTLDSLDLSGNCFERFPGIDPSEKSENILTNLRRLNLGDNGLLELTDDLALMANIKVIHLNMNKISSIQPVMGLSQLEVLEASMNRITSIPDAINNLIHITQMDLSYNDLSDLPPMSNLTNLRVISLIGNNISEMPSSLVELKLNAKLVEPLEPSEIIPEKLFLGPFMCAKNKYRLKKMKVTHVITVIKGQVALYPEDFKYHVISIHDDDSESIIDHFEDTYEFINDAIQSNGVVYVHWYISTWFQLEIST